jgi:hypothetical protein
MKGIIKGIFIIIIIFIIKLISIIYLQYLGRCQLVIPGKDNLFSYSGDAFSYINPWENLITKGIYSLDGNTPYAGRMPFVGLPYFLFRLFSAKDTSLNLLIIFQLLVSSIATFYMCKLFEKVFYQINHRLQKITYSKYFWGFLIFSLISFYVTHFDYYVLSESLAISFLCLFSYHYYIYLAEKRSNKQLVQAGFFLSLTALWKPYFGLLFVPVAAELLWVSLCGKRQGVKSGLKKTFISCLIVFLPMIVMDLPWILRNAITFHKFIPFQIDIYANYSYPEWYKYYRTFVKKIGESIVFWDKRSFACYFEDFNHLECEYKLPSRLLGKHLTEEKIEKQKKLFLRLKNNSGDTALQRVVIQGFKDLSEDFKKDHPYTYWLIPRIMHVKAFLFHSGSYYFPVRRDSPCFHIFHQGVKLFQSLLYYMCLIFGTIGLLIILNFRRNTYMFAFIPLFLIVFFPVILMASEFRYFHPAYPFLSLGFLYGLFKIKEKLKP